MPTTMDFSLIFLEVALLTEVAVFIWVWVDCMVLLPALTLSFNEWRPCKVEEYYGKIIGPDLPKF